MWNTLQKSVFARFLVASFHYFADKFKDLNEMTFHVFSAIDGQDGRVGGTGWRSRDLGLYCGSVATSDFRQLRLDSYSSLAE